METVYHYNLKIKVTIKDASNEYYFYLNDILNEMTRRDPANFQFSIARPEKENILDIMVTVLGCSEGFKNYVFGVFNKLSHDDPKVFSYKTVTYDYYKYTQAEIEKRNLKQCDKLFDTENK